MSQVQEHRGKSQGQTVSPVADRADWPQARVAGNRGAPVPMPGLRPEFRDCPPFAPAYASYTHRLQGLVEDLWGMMTVTDLAVVSGLGWDTVKNIIKGRLEKDYGHPRLQNS